MFNFFSRSRQKPSPRQADLPGVQALTAFDIELLTGFLCRTTSVLPITKQEAALASRYFCARHYHVNEIIIRAGDNVNTDHMLWILDGEASIETRIHTADAPIYMTVLGAGSALGEMGLIDGSIRSVNCIASAPTRCAILTKDMLQALCNEQPAVAAKLMSVICIGVSVRLRDITEKFKRYVQLNRALSDELNALTPLDELS
ncbi:MAG: cyclic nucleotide-binding domain-containing protein [Burkholderiaceae bacterium]